MAASAEFLNCERSYIAALDEDSLANEIFVVQKKFNFPGLVQECTDLLKDLDLPDITNRDIASGLSKIQWKRELKKKIHDKCEAELKERMSTYSKLKDGPAMTESFGMRDYMREMTIEDARVKFALRSEMYDVSFNYRSDPKNSADLWKCDSCMSGHIQTQSHILFCEAFADLRKDKDLKSDKDLVNYMKNVLIIREKLDLLK